MGHRETILKKTTLKALLESPWRSEDTYVTAGAYMHCSYGSHEEVLNKPEPNGIYINGSPMLTVEDCKVSLSTPNTIVGIPFDRMGQEIDGNFYSFGFCRSEQHPMKLAESAGAGMPSDPSYIIDTDPEEPTFNLPVYPCAPKLMAAPAPAGAPFKSAPPIGLPSGLPSLSAMLEKLKGPQWTNGSPSVSIQGAAALTSKSCLFCQYGGQIRLLTNGMDPAPPEFSVR
ncbi:hypothetical protein BBD42_13560 [Paenibacillus sp. BIHB 4019]|uniref:DUF4280 domain-containing protein n=1 Tax=Paenibacillus sp. BIHB 4019 TaxID=1870819 RepID=A0A1B2DI48_9BACL|nr:DUF4280 domain-containing protein [Paenibacillus sp. BIHB 4019]ANY67388.1 hypothetical protein BBD42_13560 [Paenibacillus sp. BIHB 4019]